MPHHSASPRARRPAGPPCCSATYVGLDLRCLSRRRRIAEAIGRIYASADLAVRLPLHGGFATCRRIHDVPFIARRSRRDPAHVRQALGLPADRPLALVSFGGYGVEQLDLDALARTSRHGIVMTGATRIDGAPLQTHEGHSGLFSHSTRPGCMPAASATRTS